MDRKRDPGGLCAIEFEGIASTFNTALEILVIGQNPSAMASAVNRVVRMGGGIAAIEEGEVVFEFPLPIGGMMSERSLGEVAEKEAALKEFLFEPGVTHFMTRFTRSSFSPTIFCRRPESIAGAWWTSKRMRCCGRRESCRHDDPYAAFAATKPRGILPLGVADSQIVQRE